MPDSTFGFPQEDWNRALQQTRILLLDTARRNGIIYYSDIVDGIDAIQLSMNLDKDRGALGELLGKISRQTNTDGIGMLSAVAVSKTTNRPTDSFFELARMLGYDIDDRDAFWIEQYRKVTSHYSTQS